MTNVTDEQLGKIGREYWDLFRRVREGTLDPAYVSWGLQQIIQRKIGHIVDCDQKPYEPNGLTVLPESEQLSGRVRGQFVLTPASMRLHLSPNQQNGNRIKGTELAKELANMPVLPANVLDAYLAHPELIPEELKGKVTYFWGTKYRHSDGVLYVRCLYFGGGGWYSFYRWLGRDWHGIEPAAVRAS